MDILVLLFNHTLAYYSYLL